MTALDVGQGSCTLLQCNGAAFVVDCGGSYGADAADQAARTLMSQGIFHLEGLAVTHYDEDHVAGVETLLCRMDVREVYVPDAPGMEEFCCRLRQIAPDVTIIPVSEDMACSVGEGKITIFAPGPGKSDNDRGIAVLFQRGKYDTLITGDLGTVQEHRLIYEKDLPDCEVLVAGHHGSSGIAVLFQRGKYDTLITGDLGTVQEHRLIYEKDLPDCEVLVAGHHGSNHSTSAKLLDHIAPEVVMISVGVDNSYGHPGTDIRGSRPSGGWRSSDAGSSARMRWGILHTGGDSRGKAADQDRRVCKSQAGNPGSKAGAALCVSRRRDVPASVLSG